MRKKILLIGNNSGLPGVNTDITNFGQFFKSSRGGGWFDSEIITLIQPSTATLKTNIASLRQEKLDYLIILFSGHGGQVRKGTILEINENGDTILESELHNIATRQLNIFDCCRAFVNMSEHRRSFTAKYMDSNLTSTRARYEKRIMEAIPQQCLLYACSIGETASDTSQGGAYSKNLLAVVKSSSTEFTTVGVAHTEAKERTEREFPRQHPDSILPRCMTAQSLIIGINPNLPHRVY